MNKVWKEREIGMVFSQIKIEEENYTVISFIPNNKKENRKFPNVKTSLSKFAQFSGDLWQQCVTSLRASLVPPPVNSGHIEEKMFPIRSPSPPLFSTNICLWQYLFFGEIQIYTSSNNSIAHQSFARYHCIMGSIMFATIIPTPWL